MWLPAVACFLPGAVCLHVEREPRDMAISMFLSFFNPRWYGWMSSLDSIRRVIDAERSIVRPALSCLGIPHESFAYEALVADPAGHATRCLARLGLPMHGAVLAPEGNRRAVHTLSHEQVRRPINA
ncbi:MAG: sulfotransferase, partial [bacterium]